MKGVFCLLIVLLVMRWGDADNEIFFLLLYSYLIVPFLLGDSEGGGAKGLIDKRKAMQMRLDGLILPALYYLPWLL